MKVTLQRQSGRPVRKEDNKAFNDQWREKFDTLAAAYSAKYKEFSNNEITREELDEESKIMNQKCDDLEKAMLTEYDLEITVDLPKNGKQWKELQEEFNYPTMLHHDGKRIYLVLLDVGL